MKDTLLIPGLEGEKASPDFSRLRDAVLRQGRSDRLPFLELLADPEIVCAVLGRPSAGYEDYIEFYYRLGYDAMAAHTCLIFASPHRTAQDTANLSRGERSWVTEDTCPIKTREDFERYQWPDPEACTDVHSVEQAAKLLPEGMGFLLHPHGGILENVMWLMGYEGLASALYDDPELVEDMFKEVGDRTFRSFERVIGCPEIGGVFFGEDMGFKTATMIAPAHLRKYLFPHLKRLTDLAHKHGKFFILHSCGNISEIMDDLIDSVGIDARHAYEDVIMPVTEFKRLYGRRIGVIGGIDLDALTRLPVDELRKYVRRVLDECAPGGGYALGTGNSVANYIKLENYLAMLEEGWRYRTSREV